MSSATNNDNPPPVPPLTATNHPTNVNDKNNDENANHENAAASAEAMDNHDINNGNNDIDDDPLTMLLRQELERELDGAWRAYQSLAQSAWESDATPVLSSTTTTASTSGRSALRARQRGGGIMRRGNHSRGTISTATSSRSHVRNRPVPPGRAAENPIVLVDD